MSLPPEITGYLATECPSCDGTGDIVVKRGLEQLPWRYDCDDCRSTGWVIHSDIPAISIGYVLGTMDSMHRDTSGWEDDHAFNQAEGWNDALRSVTNDINANFEEAR